MTEQQATTEADEHGHDWGSDVERVEHGFAPSIDPANIKPREQREAEAREAIGDDANAPILKDGRPLTDAEEAERYNRLRSYPSVPPVPTRGVIVNGVAMVVPAGDDAASGDVPAEATEVLENAARPLRTGQAKGLGNGLRTFDLTAPEGSPQRGGDLQAALQQRAAASAAQAEAQAEGTTPPPAPAAPPPPPKPATKKD
jgi:hypothetical protein